MKVTKWSLIDSKTSKIHFNHIEDGWVEGDKPLPIKPEYTNQLAWQNHKWVKSYRYLENGKVVGGWVYTTKKMWRKVFYKFNEQLFPPKK